MFFEIKISMDSKLSQYKAMKLTLKLENSEYWKFGICTFTDSTVYCNDL